MSLNLGELLTLVGRLDDAPGSDTPRERFRRFITERVTTVGEVRELLAQSQEALGDQHARARQDLVALLGRFLGFEVSFGGYQPHDGAARLEGHWRSRRRARIAIEVRCVQTVGTDVEELARTVAALSATTPADLDERWVGLCVTTPFYAAARRLETLLAQRESRDIRCVSVESLLWLAEMAATDRVAHTDVLRLLTSGPDSDFMIDLMRRLTDEAGCRSTAIAAAPDERSGNENDEPAPHLSIVAKPEREPDTGFWLASLVQDETATPEQLLEAVILRRQVLGISNSGPFSTPARGGDQVCFLILGSGIVGHGQLDTAIADASAVIRGAGRFTTVFRLKSVTVYDAPKVVEDDSVVRWMADHAPLNATGAFLTPISRLDYESWTSGFLGDAHASSS